MFMDGLVGNDALKMKILLDNPAATATKEQNLRARANISSHYHSPYKSERKEEPMESDHKGVLNVRKQTTHVKHVGLYTY